MSVCRRLVSHPGDFRSKQANIRRAAINTQTPCIPLTRLHNCGGADQKTHPPPTPIATFPGSPHPVTHPGRHDDSAGDQQSDRGGNADGQVPERTGRVSNRQERAHARTITSSSPPPPPPNCSRWWWWSGVYRVSPAD